MIVHPILVLLVIVDECNKRRNSESYCFFQCMEIYCDFSIVLCDNRRLRSDEALIKKVEKKIKRWKKKEEYNFCRICKFIHTSTYTHTI